LYDFEYDRDTRVARHLHEMAMVIKTMFSGAIRSVALCFLPAVAPTVAAQPTYPSQPIRIIVPFPPGGSVDPLARLVEQKLAESWGQQVVVDNRPGGNSIIGTQAAVKAKPDGYTLLYVTGTHVINANLLSTPYDAIKDFAWLIIELS
jgi:tripartite-type tricarboxylate transporter receptor subunit TctC